MNFSETIVVCDIKVSRCSQLNEYMNIYEYQSSSHSLTFVKGHSDSTFSDCFSLETARLSETKFFVEPPWDEGMKVSTNGLCHMTKMAAMPIYDKKPLKSSFPEPKSRMTLKLGMRHWLLEYYQFYSNDDHGLTLTYFMARSDLVLFVFVWESADFQETIEAYEVKVGTYSQINEYMMIYDNPVSVSLIDLCPGSLRFNIVKFLFLKTHKDV